MTHFREVILMVGRLRGGNDRAPIVITHPPDVKKRQHWKSVSITKSNDSNFYFISHELGVQSYLYKKQGTMRRERNHHSRISHCKSFLRRKLWHESCTDNQSDSKNCKLASDSQLIDSYINWLLPDHSINSNDARVTNHPKTNKQVRS